MPYDGRYGKVAGAMKRKRAVNRFGVNKPRNFQAGGGSQKVPPNTGVPKYKHGDSSSGAPQDKRATRMRPSSMQMRSPSKGQRPANAPTQGSPPGPRSPMPKSQDGGKNPTKRDAREKAGGFRSFQSIIKGNVMGMRPPKKLPKNSRPVKGRGKSYGY